MKTKDRLLRLRLNYLLRMNDKNKKRIEGACLMEVN
jgi:hypothetical protein